MRFRPFNRRWARFRRGLPYAAACAAALALPACGTATIEDAETGAAHAGRYPNLNIPQVAATEQLSDEETAAATAQLSAARATLAAQPSTPPESRAGELKRLGKTHVEETLEAIEE
jgi:hypothetical protein